MRILAPLALLLCGGLLVLASSGANAPDRPPGVDAKHWVTLGPSIGVVLSSDAEPARNADSHTWETDPRPMAMDKNVLIAPTRPVAAAAVQHAEAQEPVQGYLMVRREGVWRRLVVTAP